MTRVRNASREREDLRHCEARRAEAIQGRLALCAGLLRCARPLPARGEKLKQAISFSRCIPHPSCFSRTNLFALRTDLRQRMPAVDAGILTICVSSHECKKRKQGSGTPRDAYPTDRTRAGCGARRALRARLSASHHGTCCSERTPQLNPSYALPGTGLGRSGCYPLPAVLQCSGL